MTLEADVSSTDDTQAIFAAIKQRCGRLDAFISNASAAVTVHDLQDYTERALRDGEKLP